MKHIVYLINNISLKLFEDRSFFFVTTNDVYGISSYYIFEQFLMFNKFITQPNRDNLKPKKIITI